MKLGSVQQWLGMLLSIFIGHFGYLFILTSLLCGAMPASAESAISGEIAANTRWSQRAGPYIVSGEVIIQNDAVLTIEPGVTIYMASGASLTVRRGGIRALGTVDSHIVVRSERVRSGLSAAPGDWKQWVFTPGTSETQLDYVEFEHGSGLLVQGAAPVFNNLDLRNHLGAALTVDLAASPRGVGLQASGNTINGIAVPAGEISGAVRWGLRGIPYVVTAGTVSVGSAPVVETINLKTIEQGQTVTMLVSGSRLTGLQEAVFDRTGLQATIFPGGSSSQASLQVRALPTAQTGAAQLRLRTDAGDVVVNNAITVTVPQPTISALDPVSVLAGAGAQEIKVSGRNFTAFSEVLFNSAAASTQFVNATELRATLPNQTATGTLRVQVRTADQSLPGQELLSTAADLPVRAPVPPTLSVEPTPIALPPDNKPRQIAIRFSKADYRDHRLDFAIADPSKASVSPASLTVPAGETKAVVNVTSMVAGTTNLQISSPTLATVQIPMFITNDFRGVNTAISAPVGLIVTAVPVPVIRDVTVTQPLVGVAVGAVLTGVTPRAWGAGSETQLTVQGRGIPAGAQLALSPSTGISIDSVSVDADGAQLKAVLKTAADAPLGARKLVIRDIGGREILFADPSKAVVSVMSGLPVIESTQPFAVVRGGMVNLLIRGRNLQQGLVRIAPDDGIAVDTVPQVSADGTSLTVRLAIAPDARLGSRVVQVATPAGATADEAISTNTLTIASAVQSAPGAVLSLPVGVRVGPVAESEQVLRNPASPVVGILVGAGVTDVLPKVGVIDSDVEVAVRGTGLQGLSSVSLEPAAGVSVVSAPIANAEGTEVRFTVRIDARAELGLRRLVLQAQGQHLNFVRQDLAAFLISAPLPELQATAPQVVIAGQSATVMTVRGRNFINVSGVRIEPGEGLTVGPAVANASGNLLNFTLQAAAGAAPGLRTIVVSSAAGDSGAIQTVGNMVRIATQAGPTYADISAPAVGVVLGEVATPPVSVDRQLVSSAVGVQIGEPAVPVKTMAASSAMVGVLVGTGGQSLSPSGWLRGTSGTILVAGQGLERVTAASVVPDTGVLLGSLSINADGTQLQLPITVAPDAPLTARQLRLRTVDKDLVFAESAGDRLAIGQAPTLSSIAPIVLERGKSVALTIRGSNLAGVTDVIFAPADGLRAVSTPIWNQDSYGEYLTVNVAVTDAAALGARVLRLVVPGGMSSAEAQSSNTVTVVVPQ